MIPRYYKVFLDDGTETEEFVYSPVEAAECALLCWIQQNPREEIPKVVAIRAADNSLRSAHALIVKPYKGILTKKDRGEIKWLWEKDSNN
jgi:hypothetical protein